MTATEVAFVALAGFGTAAFLTPLFRALSVRLGVLDLPNERSSHSVATPRSGGKAMLMALACAAIVAARFTTLSPLAGLGAGVVFIATSGLIDDVRGLHEWQKLALQIAGAATYVFISGDLLTRIGVDGWSVALGAASVPLTILWLVGFTNVFNFMDGVNGIAGSQAVVSGTVVAALALRHDELATAVVGVAVAAVAAGFLPWNFPRASIFMGDTGSATLGFLLAAAAVRLAPHGFVVAVLPMLPFLFDTTVTLAMRIMKRERWLTAHRSHLYQRLTDLGWGHAEVSLLWTALAVLGGATALLWPSPSSSVNGLVLLALLLGAHALLATVILSKHRWRAQRRSVPGNEIPKPQGR